MYIKDEEKIKSKVDEMILKMKIQGLAGLIQDVANMKLHDIYNPREDKYKKLYFLGRELSSTLFDKVYTDEAEDGKENE